jgi:hypothetical protein
LPDILDLNGIASDEFWGKHLVDGAHHDARAEVVARRSNSMEARLIRLDFDDCPCAVATGADTSDARNCCHGAQGNAALVGSCHVMEGAQ